MKEDDKFRSYILSCLENITLKILCDSHFKGTGFFISEDGYILTAYHCIKEYIESDNIFVETTFKDQYKAYFDEDKSLKDDHIDVAVLKIKEKTDFWLPLGFITKDDFPSEIVSTGYPVYDQAIGYYPGQINRFSGETLFEHNVPKGKGQSGSPLYHYATNRIIGMIKGGYPHEILENAGLAVRFESLFKKWPGLKDINNSSCKNWDLRLETVFNKKEIQDIKRVNIQKDGSQDKDILVSLKKIRETLPKIDNCEPVKSEKEPIGDPVFSVALAKRLELISKSMIKTVNSAEKEINEAIQIMQNWMLNSTIVRIIGVGRARLAASIPANRLAHGGARVYIQDDMIPMPHSISGGGIIAVSASGKTDSVLKILENSCKKYKNIEIIGIAAKNADKFKKMCAPPHIFIGIDLDDSIKNPLKALADIEESIISMLLDALVVAAGKKAGFDDIRWGIGHEDIGRTGPYNPVFKPIEKRDYFHTDPL